MFQDELRRMSDEKKRADQNRVSYEFGIDSDNIDSRVIRRLMYLCDWQAREGKDNLTGFLYCDGENDFGISNYMNGAEFVYRGMGVVNQKLGDYVTTKEAPCGKEKQFWGGWDDWEMESYCISGNKDRVEKLADIIEKKLAEKGLRKVNVNVKNVNIVWRRMRETGLFKKKYSSWDTAIATGYRVYIDIKW